MQCSKPVDFRKTTGIRISDVSHPNKRLDFRPSGAYLVVVRRSKAPDVPKEYVVFVADSQAISQRGG
jgi:hypothetical protein